MTPVEHHVDAAVSHYYVYVPSRNALSMFLYPTRIGLYRYLKGYWLNRGSFDSFILMAVYSGTFTFTVNGRRSTANTGDLVLLDCHEPNVYQAQAETDCTLLWMHFDGRLAHDYFKAIHGELGTVVTLKRATYAISRFRMIYDTFAEERKVNEARMSLAITEILTECLTAHDDAEQRAGAPYNQHAIEETLSYIATHLNEPLPVAQLAAMALMSEYYYIRVFRQVTGYTPHTYIVNARMHAAKYMLVTGDATLKEICAACGFSSTSAFCASFRKRFGVTPLGFRDSSRDLSHDETSHDETSHDGSSTRIVHS